ncbi:hypothetical protein GEMRC1_008939 [Eukaryota sp. GEM-RC1]
MDTIDSISEQLLGVANQSVSVENFKGSFAQADPHLVAFAASNLLLVECTKFSVILEAVDFVPTTILAFYIPTYVVQKTPSLPFKSNLKQANLQLKYQGSNLYIPHAQHPIISLAVPSRSLFQSPPSEFCAILHRFAVHHRLSPFRIAANLLVLMSAIPSKDLAEYINFCHGIRQLFKEFCFDLNHWRSMIDFVKVHSAELKLNRSLILAMLYSGDFITKEICYAFLKSEFEALNGLKIELTKEIPKFNPARDTFAGLPLTLINVDSSYPIIDFVIHLITFDRTDLVSDFLILINQVTDPMVFPTYRKIKCRDLSQIGDLFLKEKDESKMKTQFDQFSDILLQLNFYLGAEQSSSLFRLAIDCVTKYICFPAITDMNKVIEVVSSVLVPSLTFQKLNDDTNYFYVLWSKLSQLSQISIFQKSLDLFMTNPTLLKYSDWITSILSRSVKRLSAETGPEETKIHNLILDVLNTHPIATLPLLVERVTTSDGIIEPLSQLLKTRPPFKFVIDLFIFALVHKFSVALPIVTTVDEKQIMNHAKSFDESFISRLSTVVSLLCRRNNVDVGTLFFNVIITRLVGGEFRILRIFSEILSKMTGVDSPSANQIDDCQVDGVYALSLNNLQIRMYTLRDSSQTFPRTETVEQLLTVLQPLAIDYLVLILQSISSLAPGGSVSSNVDDFYQFDSSLLEEHPEASTNSVDFEIILDATTDVAYQLWDFISLNLRASLTLDQFESLAELYSDCKLTFNQVAMVYRTVVDSSLFLNKNVPELPKSLASQMESLIKSQSWYEPLSKFIHDDFFMILFTCGLSDVYFSPTPFNSLRHERVISYEVGKARDEAHESEKEFSKFLYDSYIGTHKKTFVFGAKEF